VQTKGSSPTALVLTCDSCGGGLDPASYGVDEHGLSLCRECMKYRDGYRDGLRDAADGLLATVVQTVRDNDLLPDRAKSALEHALNESRGS
jgi:hypothetical protein